MGITVHRMTEHIDAGPILAQVDDLPIPGEVTSEHVWDLTTGALPNLLAEALGRVGRGEQGTLQDENMATRAGFPTPDWYKVTWGGSRRDLHNQIRALRFLTRGRGPVVEFQGRMVQVLGTSLADDGSVRIECVDGPLWVTVTPRDLPRAVPRALRASALPCCQ
jgi:methionyl-tRNA formyltransferase